MDSSVRSLVCENCWAGPFERQTFAELKKGRDVVYSTTWSRVQVAADDGCGLCSLLISDKEDHKDEVTFRLQLFSIQPSSAGFQPVTPLHVQYLSVEVEDCEIEMDNNGYYLYTSLDDRAATEIVARDPLREVRSQKAYLLALDCLQDCITNHQNCPTPNNDTLLPTRVIDCSDPAHPRIFVSRGASASYAALSYVWGGKQPNCTVTANLEAYVQGIDIELIPETIRDAIEATSRLGLRYLWVDAFCIIQDSSEDKKSELVQLRRIFRDAYLTIIASCAESAYAGFLHDRAPLTPPPPRLPFWCQDGRIGTVYTQPATTSYDAPEQPVNQRAWCLEERLLSARKLVYASDTLQYHCQSAVQYVGGAICGPRNAERLPDVMFVPDTAVGAHLAAYTRLDWREMRYAWADTVGNYTRRAVTKPKDKLTALAGVAEQFHRVWHWYPGSHTSGDDAAAAGAGSQGRYLAGLWERFLMQELLWATSEERRPRPTLYLAPSWSWASIDVRVTLYRAFDKRLDIVYVDEHARLNYCEIVSCEVEVEDTRLPYGRVKSGLVRLRAEMVAVATAWDADALEPRLVVSKDGVGSRVSILAQEEAEADSSLRCVGEVRPDSTDEVRGQVWAVPIAWNVGPTDFLAAGLLVTEASDGHFRRIGFWETPELLDDDEDYGATMFAWFHTDDREVMRVVEII